MLHLAHLAAVQVTSSRRWDVGAVACPYCIGLFWLEVAIQQVGGNRHSVSAVDGHHIPALATGLDAMLFHEFLDTVFANSNTFCQQLFPDSGPAVFAFATGMSCLNMRQHGFVAPGPEDAFGSGSAICAK